MDEFDLESLFDRYRREHDLAALGRVFDATAPELLALARHFAPRGSDARDLLSETFLAAIESAGTFEPPRRVRPWLVGILLNRARRIRRATGREAIGLDADEVEERSPDVDSSTRAAQSELATRLAAAFATLAGAQRDAAIRVLLQGATSVEVAQDSGRTAGAVRKLVERARATLRRALGPSLLGVGGVSVLDRIACAATRRMVLRAAATRHGIPIAGSYSTIAASIALVVATGALVWIATNPRSEPSDSHDPPLVAQGNIAPSATKIRDEANPEPAESRDVVTTDSVRRGVVAAAKEISAPAPNVTGRLVIDGRPATGRRLVLAARNSKPLDDEQTIAPAPATPYQRRAVVVSDSDGRFEGFVFTRTEVTIEVQPIQPDSLTRIRGSEYSVVLDTPRRDIDLSYDTQRLVVRVTETRHGVIPRDLAIGVQIVRLADHHPDHVKRDRNPIPAKLIAAPVPDGYFEFTILQHDTFIAFATASCHDPMDQLVSEWTATRSEIRLSIRSRGGGVPAKLRVRWPNSRAADDAATEFASSLLRSVRLASRVDPKSKYEPKTPGFFAGNFDFDCLPPGEYVLLADPPFPVREPTIVTIPAAPRDVIQVAPILDGTPRARFEGRLDAEVIESLTSEDDPFGLRVRLAPTTFPENEFVANVDRENGTFTFDDFPTGATILKVGPFDPFRPSPPQIELRFDAPPRAVVPIVLHRDRVEVLP